VITTKLFQYISHWKSVYFLKKKNFSNYLIKMKKYSNILAIRHVRRNFDFVFHPKVLGP